MPILPCTSTTDVTLSQTHLSVTNSPPHERNSVWVDLTEMSGYRGRGRRYRGVECGGTLLRVSRLTPFSDDYREPVQETPEQRLRSTILKLGEVVRWTENPRMSPLFSYAICPARTLCKNFTG